MKKSKTILLSKFIFFFFLLSIIYTVYFVHQEPVSFYDENVKEITGTIIEIKKIDNGYRFIIEGQEKVIVYYYNEITAKLGNEVKVIGEMSRPSENTVFNLFNYRDYLKSEKIYWQMKADNVSFISLEEGIYVIKNKLLDYINKFNSYRYLKAFILGDDDDIDQQVYDSYQLNGISHLLAISGSQITLLSLILLFILNLFSKKEKINYFIVILLLLFYMFLTGFLPPIVRATWLFICLTIKKFIAINVKTIYLLLLIAAFYLFYNPFIIMNIGFLFSFVICFYLILFSDYIKDIKSYLMKTFVISLIAFISSIPILIYNFHYINFLSPFINLIFVPLVTFLIYPLSLVVMVIPSIDNFYLSLCNFMEDISLYISNFDNFIITLKHINIYLIILYYLFITLVIYKMSLRQYFYLYFLIFILFFHHNINYFNDKAFLTMIDVGQGDCFLVVLPHNKGNILIDTGGEVSFDGESYDLSSNVILPYLKSEGVDKLDYLILTHGDFDHAGMADKIIENFKVDNILLNSGSNNELEETIIKLAEEKGINIQNIKNYNFSIDDATINIMSSGASDENDDSLIIEMKINNYNLLFMGDASKNTEKYIIDNYNISDIDILKVGHHGSKTSSSEEFIETITPDYALISVGENNIYGHPNDEVINILKNVEIFRTDINGSVKFLLNNKIRTYLVN